MKNTTFILCWLFCAAMLQKTNAQSEPTRSGTEKKLPEAEGWRTIIGYIMDENNEGIFIGEMYNSEFKVHSFSGDSGVYRLKVPLNCKTLTFFLDGGSDHVTIPLTASDTLNVVLLPYGGYGNGTVTKMPDLTHRVKRSQPTIVTGQITGTMGTTAIRPRVRIEGTETVVYTDKDGNYTLTVPPQYDILSFESDNYAARKVLLGDFKTLNVSVSLWHFPKDGIYNPLTLPANRQEQLQIKELHWYFKELSVLPADIRVLENLTDLRLFNNNFSVLPPDIMALKKLRYLGLGSNKLSALPAEIKALKNLRALDLSDNNFTEFPVEIKALKNLRALDLSDNNFTEFPVEILALKKLESLDLDRNGIKSLPPEIAQLRHLRYLYLDIGNFSNEEREKIRKMLPKCKVSFWER